MATVYLWNFIRVLYSFVFKDIEWNSTFMNPIRTNDTSVVYRKNSIWCLSEKKVNNVNKFLPINIKNVRCVKK